MDFLCVLLNKHFLWISTASKSVKMLGTLDQMCMNKFRELIIEHTIKSSTAKHIDLNEPLKYRNRPEFNTDFVHLQRVSNGESHNHSELSTISVQF